EALNSRIPNHSQMEPGRVYVGRLPNHNGPVLVRRRRKSFTNPFGVPSVASLWAPPRAPSLDYQNTITAIYQPQPQSQTLIAQPRIYTTPPQVVEPPAYLGLPPPQPVGTTTTTITTTEAQATLNTSSKHTCPACGKFRSARYHYRHPLAPGETPRPTHCRKCIKQHTSSEEFDEIERARWKNKKEQEARQRRIHRSSSSEHWESSSSQEGRRRRHRYRSSNDSRRHRRFPRSSSGMSNTMYIIHRPAERRRLRSSSESLALFLAHVTVTVLSMVIIAMKNIILMKTKLTISVVVGVRDLGASVGSLMRIPTVLMKIMSGFLHRYHIRGPSAVVDGDGGDLTSTRRKECESLFGRETQAQSDTSAMSTMHRDATTLETRGNDYFDRQRPSGRSFASSSQIQTRRARSPSILRRRSMENGMRDGRRVRFAHSDASEEGFRSA
ncbi:MAG: hypothetical protein LQ341_006899, partial [Variospora aurantia]